MKYIDAEKLNAEIKRRIEWLSPATNDFAEGRRAELRSIYDFVTYLQQEQLIKSELKEEKIECSPVIKEFIGKFFEVGRAYNFGFGPKDFQQEQPSLPSDLDEAAEKYANKEFPDESSCGQWGTGDYEPPVDMEYPREIAKESFQAGAEWMAERMKQEQTATYDEAYLNEKIEKATKSWEGIDVDKFMDEVRGRGPEVDLEKASRNVYESWMGGTMDDVRRDMVELGKVLNARKDE